MVKPRPGRPPALKHGLASRYAREEWSEGVTELSDALLGSSPHAPRLVEAAREAAEAMIYLHRVRRWRLAVLEGGALARLPMDDTTLQRALELSRAAKFGDGRDYASQRAALGATTGDGIDIDAERALLQEVMERDDTLRNLCDYERRALSQRRKALRRLDYERIEAERRPRPRVAVK